ncbi:unnamed protein product, partial [Ectocarpus sp. 12 AP-2014]
GFLSSVPLGGDARAPRGPRQNEGIGGRREGDGDSHEGATVPREQVGGDVLLQGVFHPGGRRRLRDPGGRAGDGRGVCAVCYARGRQDGAPQGPRDDRVALHRAVYVFSRGDGPVREQQAVGLT